MILQNRILNNIDATGLSKKFYFNTNFPFLLIDNFLENGFFNKLNKSIDASFAHSKNNLGKNFSTDVEIKDTSLNIEPSYELNELLNFFSSGEWINFLKEICKFKNLYSAKVDNKKLANFHRMSKNGYLGPHVDHSHDPHNLNNAHVLNTILYFSKNWNQNYGGATQFYDKNGKSIIGKAEYVPNRLVIFLHTPQSFHGVEKISDKCDVDRRTVYFDYYSEDKNPYSNLYNVKNFRHNTTFILPKKTDYIKIKNIAYLKSILKYNFNKIFS